MFSSVYNASRACEGELLGVVEEEVLEVEKFVCLCSEKETKEAIDLFGFNESAVVTHAKWLGYNRKSSVTITAAESDGGTIDDALFYSEMPRFRLLPPAAKEKLGKAAELKKWAAEQLTATGGFSAD